MPAHVMRHVECAAIPPQARRQRVEEDHDHSGEEHGRERAIVQHALDRQPIHEEAEVHLHVRIRFAERYSVSQQREHAPAVRGKREPPPEHERNEQRRANEIAPGHLLADLDVGDAPRKHERDDALPHYIEIHEENIAAAARAEPAQIVVMSTARSRQSAAAPIERTTDSPRRSPHHAADHEQHRDDRERDDRPPAPADGDAHTSGDTRANALRAQPAFHLPANGGEPLGACAPRSASRAPAACSDARINPQPSPKSTRAPSTSITSCVARKWRHCIVDDAGTCESPRHVHAKLRRRYELRARRRACRRAMCPTRRRCGSIARRHRAHRRGRRNPRRRTCARTSRPPTGACSSCILSFMSE